MVDEAVEKCYGKICMSLSMCLMSELSALDIMISLSLQGDNSYSGVPLATRCEIFGFGTITCHIISLASISESDS